MNQEYQGLLSEINRQAASINLNTGGLYNTNLVTYVGGGDSQPDSQVSVNLTGANNAVDSTALGIAATTVAGGGTELTGNTVDLNNTAVTFLQNSVDGVAATQTFNFNITTATGNTPVAVTVTGNASNPFGGLTSGITGADVITQLNTALATYGITASIANDGQLEFGGNTAFTVNTGILPVLLATNSWSRPTASTAINTANYNVDSFAGGGAFTGFTTGSESISFQNALGTTNVVLGSAAANPLNASDLTTTLQTLNTAPSGTGISAVANADRQYRCLVSKFLCLSISM